MSNLRRYCAGIKQTGYWKGNPCGAFGIYKSGTKWYCANHLPEVMKARGKKPATRVDRGGEDVR